MEHMGMWLALKDGNSTQREWADRHKHHATAYATKGVRKEGTATDGRLIKAK